MGPALLLAAIVWLVALENTKSTSYEPQGNSRYGYNHEQISQKVFRVSFKGNDFTPDHLAKNYAIHRAAELMKEQGWEYFYITEIKYDPFEYTRNKITKVGENDYRLDTETYTYPRYFLTVIGFDESEKETMPFSTIRVQGFLDAHPLDSYSK